MGLIGDIYWSFRGDGARLQKDAQVEGAKAGTTLGKSTAESFKKSWSGSEIGKGLVQGLGLAGGLGAAKLIGDGLGFVKDAIAGTVESAIDFEKSMQNVNSIAHLSDTALKETGRSLLKMAGDFGQSAQTMADGLYDISSSGFQGADALKVLEAATKSATAGLATTGQASKGITAVLNAYGMSADKAADVSDVLFETVNRGVITFPELSDQIGKTTALSAPLNVSLREVAAAVALMTRNGVGAEDAFTQINAVMSSMLQPSQQAADMAEQLGLQWDAAALKSNGLVKQMQLLIKATGGDESKMAVLLGDARAIRGAFVLAQKGGQSFTDELVAMGKAAGATDRAFAEQSKSTAFHIAQMNAKIEAASIVLGEKLLPFIAEAADLVTDNLVPALEDLADALDATGEAAANNEDPMQNLVNIFHDLFKAPDDEARTALGSLFDGLNDVKTGLDDAAVSLNDWWTFWDDHSSMADRKAAELAKSMGDPAKQVAAHWTHEGREASTAMDSVGDHAGDMGADIKTASETAAKSVDQMKDDIVDDAQTLINQAFDPIIAHDRLIATNAEIAAQKRIIASKSSSKEEIASAKAALHSAQKDQAELLLTLARAGDTQSKAYKTGIKELKANIKNATGPTKAYLQGVLTKLQQIDGTDPNVLITIKTALKGGYLGGARAEGGPVSKGVPYIVGEKRSELFVPNEDGRIVPRVPSSTQLGSTSAGVGDTNITVALPVTARPDPFEVADRLRWLNDFGVLAAPQSPVGPR